MSKFSDIQIGDRFFFAFSESIVRLYEKKSLSTTYRVDVMTQKRIDVSPFVQFAASSEVIPVLAEVSR